MSKTLLNRAFGLRDQGYVRTVYKGSKVYFHIEDIHKRHLRKKYAKPPLKDLTAIAIDEMYLGKALGYRTMVLDLTCGAVVYVGKGKDSKALMPFWKSLKASGARIEAVAMDMSRAYASAVTKHLPQADIVFDPFHVVKLKEDLRMLWVMSDLKSGKAWLRNWLKAAEASGIKQVKKIP